MTFTISCVPNRVIRNVGNKYWFWMSEYMLKRIKKVHPIFKIIVSEERNYVNLGSFKIHNVNEKVIKRLKGNRIYFECVVERVD